MMFYEIAKNFPNPLLLYQPYEPISGRKAWEQLPVSLQKDLIDAGENCLHYIYPPLTAVSYMSFIRTGNRGDFEEPYFQRRQVLNTLVLAECAENKGRFVDDIINGIFTICEESGWQLPAHNSYIRDMTQLILPDCSVPVLDLFACETGALLAMVSYLLKDILNTVSPLIEKRIQEELQKRIFTPYLDCHFWWMGHAEEAMNNWTIWCTQNVLIAAFTRPLPESVRKRIFLKACESVDYFLKEYGEDGCCDEGAQYYRHSGLCLFQTMEILNAVTNNEFQFLYENNKIKNIASYILQVHVKDKYYINFADCSPIAGRAGVREFLFGKRTNQPELMRFAALDHKSDDSPLLLKEINLLYRLQAAFTEAEINRFDPSTPINYKDIFYDSIGLFIARDKTYTLAVKGGDNNDSHNHNDTGSFTIYKNGLPLLIDVGVESYTKKTFSPERYEIWTMQSAYHNLPTFDGIMQKNGAMYQATEIITSFHQDACDISMNIADAYPKEARVSRYDRRCTLKKNKGILIEDTFQTTAKQVVLSLMTYEKPIAKDTGITLGNLGEIQFELIPSSISIEKIPISDPRLKTAWEHEIYRISILLQTHGLTLWIT